jgi:hypothetical protein
MDRYERICEFCVTCRFFSFCDTCGLLGECLTIEDKQGACDALDGALEEFHLQRQENIN